MAAAVVRAPSDHDLIMFVLRPMAAAGTEQQQGFVVGGGFVHVADVYSVAPEKLAERYAPAPGAGGIWYFVCPARCRDRAAKAGALGEGCWTSEAGGAAGPVRGPDGRRVGQSRALSYGTAAPWAAVTRHGWCMVELALDDQDGGGGGGGWRSQMGGLGRGETAARAQGSPRPRRRVSVYSVCTAYVHGALPPGIVAYGVK